MILNSNQRRIHSSIWDVKLKTLLICLNVLLVSGLMATKLSAQTMEDPAFAAAMSHIENGEWPQAEGLLKYILSQNPKLHRARLELGLAYAQMGSLTKAKEQLSILLAEPDVPGNVKQNITQMLKQLVADNPQETKQPEKVELGESKPDVPKSDKHHTVDGSLQISIGYDDNVRFSSADYFLEEDPFLDGFFLELEDGELVYLAPDGFVYDIDGNFLFENDGFIDLGDPDRENRFVEAKLSLNHQYQIASFAGLIWHNKVSLQSTENHQLSQYNKTQLRLETGLSMHMSDIWKWSITAHHRLLERDGQVQIRAKAVDPELTYYNNWGSWTLGLQWMRREYEDSVIVTGDVETFYYGFNSTIRAVSGKWSKLFWDNNLLLLVKFEYSDNNSDDDFNYKGTRLTLASVYEFSPEWSLLLSASDFNQDYSEVSDGPLDDKTTTFRSKLTYTLNDSVQLFLAGERALRESDVYGGIKSDKSLLKLGVEMAF